MQPVAIVEDNPVYLTILVIGQHPAELWNAALAGRDLSPAGVAVADRNIDATARWLKSHGAMGTLASLRAAVFLALLSGQSLAHLLPPGKDACTVGPAERATRPPAPPFPAGGPWSDSKPWPADGPRSAAPGGPGGLPGVVHLTLPLTAWTGQSDAPGQITGLGPFDAGACRDLGAALASHPATRWCFTLTDRHDRAVGHACSRAGPGPPGSNPAAWLVTLKITWLGAGTCDHRLETPGYRPGAKLRHLVTIRDQACIRPGCACRSDRCDIELRLPYDQGGKTCLCNLGPACRGDHQAKQAPGWHLEESGPGVLTWTLPHGRRYSAYCEPYPV